MAAAAVATRIPSCGILFTTQLSLLLSLTSMSSLSLLASSLAAAVVASDSLLCFSFPSSLGAARSDDSLCNSVSSVSFNFTTLSTSLLRVVLLLDDICLVSSVLLLIVIVLGSCFCCCFFFFSCLR